MILKHQSKRYWANNADCSKRLNIPTFILSARELPVKLAKMVLEYIEWVAL